MNKGYIRGIFFAVLLIVAAIISACFTPVENRTGLAKAPPAQSNTGQLTLDILKNTEYNSAFGTVRLRNGIYEEQVPYSAAVIHVGISENTIAWGDLNSDGVKDAALVVDSYGGGSGHFYELAVVVNDNGNPKYVTSTFIGDRVIINSITIDRMGKIVLSIMTHGPNDGMAKATLKKILRYELHKDELIEIKKGT